eukprot:361603-Chlamydomonas_euryale.AAC.1
METSVAPAWWPAVMARSHAPPLRVHDLQAEQCAAAPCTCSRLVQVQPGSSHWPPFQSQSPFRVCQPQPSAPPPQFPSVSSRASPSLAHCRPGLRRSRSRALLRLPSCHADPKATGNAAWALPVSVCWGQPRQIVQLSLVRHSPEQSRPRLQAACSPERSQQNRRCQCRSHGGPHAARGWSFPVAPSSQSNLARQAGWQHHRWSNLYGAQEWDGLKDNVLHFQRIQDDMIKMLSGEQTRA